MSSDRHEPVSPANARKPDPDEPWRYVCAECGCQVYGDRQTHNGYECAGCGKWSKKAELVDRKLSFNA